MGYDGFSLVQFEFFSHIWRPSSRSHDHIINDWKIAYLKKIKEIERN